MATNSQRLKGTLSLRLPGQATTTAYVLVVMSQRAALPAAIALKVSLETEVRARETDQFYRTAWAVSLTALLLLLLTNLPTYVRFRDRNTLFYLGTQAGAALGCGGWRRPGSGPQR